MRTPTFREQVVLGVVAGVLLSLWGVYYCDPADSYCPLRNPSGPWKMACFGRLLMPPPGPACPCMVQILHEAKDGVVRQPRLWFIPVLVVLPINWANCILGWIIGVLNWIK